MMAAQVSFAGGSSIPGSLVLFDDHPAFGLGVKVEPKGALAGVDRAVAFRGNSSLRVTCLNKDWVEVTFDLKDLIEKAPLEVRRNFLRSREEGFIQFWIRSDRPSEGIDLRFELQFPSWEDLGGEPPKEQGKFPWWVSLPMGCVS